jgi:hypothetical protein
VTPVPPMPPSRSATRQPPDRPAPAPRARRVQPVVLLLMLTALLLTILVGVLLVGSRVTRNVVADWIRVDPGASVEIAEPPAPPPPMRSDVAPDAALAQLRSVADQVVAAAGEGSWGDEPALGIESLDCGVGGVQYLAVDTFTGDPLAAERIERAWTGAGVGSGGSVVVRATATPDASGVRVLIAGDCVAPAR